MSKIKVQLELQTDPEVGNFYVYRGKGDEPSFYVNNPESAYEYIITPLDDHSNVIAKVKGNSRSAKNKIAELLEEFYAKKIETVSDTIGVKEEDDEVLSIEEAAKVLEEIESGEDDDDEDLDLEIDEDELVSENGETESAPVTLENIGDRLFVNFTDSGSGASEYCEIEKISILSEETYDEFSKGSQSSELSQYLGRGGRSSDVKVKKGWNFKTAPKAERQRWLNASYHRVTALVCEGKETLYADASGYGAVRYLGVKVDV